ncbi:hypothetical protein M8J75_009452 [Diaphorina citri]|nr:hypothetical protein M8J75_009452 [Diaphorina citri]
MRISKQRNLGSPFDWICDDVKLLEHSPRIIKTTMSELLREADVKVTRMTTTLPSLSARRVEVEHLRMDKNSLENVE